MNPRPFTRQASRFAAVVVLLGAVARAIPLDVLKRAISVLASAVWGS